MAKRKASQLETAPDATANLRRSTRHKSVAPDSTAEADKAKLAESNTRQASRSGKQKTSTKKIDTKASPVREFLRAQT
ncbi:hypothetical protein K449DRAFT_391632 [Hypoxylon sp. EC38]|nr:hypothetical protein K449DRAFT_391632 [Hypoxylon sp. EC38]